MSSADYVRFCFNDVLLFSCFPESEEAGLDSDLC